MAVASDFQRLHNAISTNITKINTNTNDLENLVRKLGTPEDSEPLRERYLRLQNETKALMQQTNDALQKLKDASTTNDSDHRRKMNLVESLPKQYLTTVTRFQKAQQIGAQKEKESLNRARAETYRQQSTSDSYYPDGISPPPGQLSQQVVLPMEQQVDLQGLRERDDQLRQLETNIVEVNELFKDVAKLVHEQGGIIDSIDNHVVEAETNVVSGNRQLVAAERYQTSARRKKIILVAIVLVILIIIALVLFLTLRKK